jgi:hypothetical protein
MWRTNQPFGKRLGQKYTDVRTTDLQPFGKRLGQKYTGVRTNYLQPFGEKVGPKIHRRTHHLFTTFWGKGWAKNKVNTNA